MKPELSQRQATIDNLVLTKVKAECDKRGWDFDSVEITFKENGDRSINIINPDISYDEAIDFYDCIFASCSEEMVVRE